MADAFLLSAARTPIGKYLGALLAEQRHDVRAVIFRRVGDDHALAIKSAVQGFLLPG